MHPMRLRIQTEFFCRLTGPDTARSPSRLHKNPQEDLDREANGWDTQWDWDDIPGELPPYLSFSHDGDRLVCASKTYFAICHKEGSEYIAGPVVKFKSSECVSAVLCLPLYSPGPIRSSTPNISVAAIIGLDNGTFLVYNEEGHQLMSHRLSNSTIVSIKLRTIGRTTLEADPLDADEITFVYADKVVVSVDGPSFWMATRISAEHQEYGEPMEQPSLLYKKWILEDQETIEDVISLGPGGVSAATPPSFNPVSGCFHTLRQSFRYIGVGSPMLCLYGTYEARQHSLRAVADRMTSAVTNVVGYAKSFWPVGSRPDSGGSYTARAPHSPHDPETLVPAARIPAAFTLNDAGRKMVSIHPCPNRALAAATDSLGRVSLIDTNEGEIVRMWKGMRDAQCGWLSAASCTLLVIYTSRGALEVWDVDGDRVAGIAMGAGWRIVECQQVLGRVFGSLNSHSHIHELHLGCLLINSFGESRKFSITEESA